VTGARSNHKISRFRPPVRRVLAVDSGSRRLKLLLAESDFGRLRMLKEELLDLRSEGLVSAEELQSHLQSLLAQFGNPPVALVLPQHLSISQVIDLPLAPESEVEKLIADETVKLSGVSESRVVYDFVRTETASRNRQQFWVTFSQEGDIRERILRLGLEQEDLCDVTTTANALMSAYRATCPLSSRAILVHLGAQTTVLVILLAGQGAFAASFQMGGDFFTRSLARQRNCSEEEAEALKRSRNFLTGPERSTEFAGVVDGWVAELKRQLSEWFQQNPAVSPQEPPFDLIASGGAFEQPGLLEHLKNKADLPFHLWPNAGQPDTVSPSKGFEIAFGTALQALGYSPQPVSLLPEDYRLSWQKRLSRQRLELASLILLALCALTLAFGTWHKLSLFSAKNALLDKVRAGQEDVSANEALSSDLVTEYENLRPVLASQQNTLDTLKTLSLLQQSHGNSNFWYVLVADQQSYFTAPPVLLATNRPAKTNLLGAAVESSHSASAVSRWLLGSNTNARTPRPGLIAELCVPGEAESARQALSELVNGLKRQESFSKVDLLSDDLRRSLADPKVVVPDRDYVLALDFAATEFQQPVRWKKPGTGPAHSSPRRTVRLKQSPDAFSPPGP
jgi:Tfp pilus assembly PilM family ATPase